MNALNDTFHQQVRTVASVQSLADRCQNGPLPEDYDEIVALVGRFVAARLQRPSEPLDEKHRAAIHSLFGDALTTPDTMMGHVFAKPFGYAGDFQIIDKIYTLHEGRSTRAKRWDRFFHAQAATQAVRNRKELFKRLLRDKASAGAVRVLDVASGPARDLEEFFSELPELAKNVEVQCVDMDAGAIAHAKSLLGTWNRRVSFTQANIFKYRSPEKYDLVWSAGLFDYFDDRTFMAVLRKCAKNVAPGGELVVGNFHPRNPTRPLMILQDWILYHRTEEDLVRLAQEALGGETACMVESEEEGVNLFLRVRGPV
ncbi:MAG: class I SAM-dependent methyltransferase [Planctomycetota bacterium]